jgi:hypothetical protein
VKRPRSFTILALLFGWLAFAGFGFAWAVTRVNSAQLNELHLDAPTLAAIGLLYGSSAAAVMVGLWLVAPWTPRAVLAWGATLLIQMVALQAMIGIAGEPWWLIILPHAVFCAITFAVFSGVDPISWTPNSP